MIDWCNTRDGDLAALGIFKRHYTYRPGRAIRQFVGPGQKLVLTLPDYSALFVWRKFKDDSGQTGVNCAVFRNESRYLSSELILLAERWAWDRWPGERLYTYVDGKKVHGDGKCFKAAGWTKLRIRTKAKRLIILEKLP
jgi:hypothetical protein